VTIAVNDKRLVFQSTRLIQGATVNLIKYKIYVLFQSTRLIQGATCLTGGQQQADKSFNPRALYKARPKMLLEMMQAPKFQSTRLIQGATIFFYVYLPH